MPVSNNQPKAGIVRLCMMLYRFGNTPLMLRLGKRLRTLFTAPATQPTCTGEGREQRHEWRHRERRGLRQGHRSVSRPVSLPYWVRQLLLFYCNTFLYHQCPALVCSSWHCSLHPRRIRHCWSLFQGTSRIFKRLLVSTYRV